MHPARLLQRRAPGTHPVLMLHMEMLAVPYYAKPRRAMLDHVKPCRATLLMPYHAMPCCATPCHAVLCHAALCHAVPCHALPCHAVPCHTALCHAVPC